MENFASAINRIENKPEMEKKSPKNFLRGIDVLDTSLSILEDDAKNGHVFTYPQMSEKTSQGKVLNIDVLSWNDTRGRENGDDRQAVTLIAKDSNSGEVVGIRLSYISKGELKYDKEKDDYVSKQKVSGEIITKLRGEGIAPALDNAFLKVITMMANDYKQRFPGNTEFDWVVENANLKRLLAKKEKGLTDSELRELETEQKRWQAIYGEGGKFGFKKTGEYDYVKTIVPEVEAGKSYQMEKVGMDKYKEIQRSLDKILISQEQS